MSWQADSPTDISAAENQRVSVQLPRFRLGEAIALRREKLILRSVLANSGTPRPGCRTAVVVTKGAPNQEWVKRKFYCILIQILILPILQGFLTS